MCVREGVHWGGVGGDRERRQRTFCQGANFKRMEDYTLHCSRVTERKRGWTKQEGQSCLNKTLYIYAIPIPNLLSQTVLIAEREKS